MLFGRINKKSTPALRHGALLLIATFSLGLLSGCGGGGMLNVLEEDPPKILGAIVADDVLNPVSSGESTSVVVRLFQLRGDVGFSQQDFFSLYQSAEERLGKEYVDMEEFVVLPGSITELPDQELNAATTHIGVLAAFRDWENSNWRGLIPVPKDEKTSVKIALKNSSVEVSSERKRWWRKAKNKIEEGQ